MTLPLYIKDFVLGTHSASQTGLHHFDALGTPTRKVENWHYTDLQKILAKDTYDATGRDCSVTHIMDDAITIKIVNGKIVNGTCVCDTICCDSSGGDTACCDSSGGDTTCCDSSGGDSAITVKNISKARMPSIVDGQQHAMASLNTAVYSDGVYIEISQDLKTPLHLAYANDGDSLATFPRVYIVVKSGVRADIVETFESNDTVKQFVNGVCEIEVQDNAIVKHYKVQTDSLDTKHIAYTGVTVGNSGSYSYTTLYLGGDMSRNEVQVDLNGTHAHADVKGLFLINGTQSVDNTVRILHNQPDCESSQLFKGILDDKATSAFQGKIYVDQVAQRTDGYQMHRAIMLSRDTQTSVKPELEIYADDVKCSHGTTTGEIDEGQLFYMVSRGIPEFLAKKLLLEAFVIEILDSIDSEKIDSFIRDLVLEKSQVLLKKAHTV